MSRRRPVLSAVPFSKQSRLLSRPSSSTASTQPAMQSPISSPATSVHPSEPSSHAASPSPSRPHSPPTQPRYPLRLFIVSNTALTEDLVQLGTRLEALRVRAQTRFEQQLTLPQPEPPSPIPLPKPSLPPRAWPRDADVAPLLLASWPSCPCPEQAPPPKRAEC
jgi:hypothetical protein